MATIVIGGIFVGRGMLGQTCPSRLVVDWGGRAIPPPPAETRPRTQFQVSRFGCALPDRTTPPEFSVFQLVPGQYRMFQITQSGPFQSPGVTPVRNTNPAETDWERFTLPRFQVAAGEVVYVGNVVFLRDFPAEIRGDSTPELARAALREVWPDGADRMIDRRMLIGPARPQP